MDPQNNKLFQISNYKIQKINENTEKKVINYLNRNLHKFDNVVVHDFGHGLISEKIINLLQKNLGTCPLTFKQIVAILDLTILQNSKN